MLKFISIVAALLMVIAIVCLVYGRALFAPSPFVIAAQVLAAVLMVWARVTFRRRSFHAAANPTEGGLVTTGPYRFMRHPIYTAVCIFCWAGTLGNLSVFSVVCSILLFMGALVRMLSEERLVVQRYPEYSAYAARTKRMFPHIFCF